ncbi:MAG TPA: bifunctional lysylphosphatidylglycerol flippase/synthetase MprF [Longimicrobiaceae bacterium]|nr:bifunctional lysylphosphatidylglycerol flippase/synthetase MprF [Longimicrobiaceae bacterium]
MSTAAENLPAALPEPERRWRWLSPAVGAALLLAAVWVLHRELREVRYREVTAALRALPPLRVFLAFLVTAVNYAILTGFDLLGFVYIGRRVNAWKVAVASFTGYAVSNSVGFALISGTSVRYRFYSRWGLTAGELSQVVLFYFGTFWLGLLVLGGWTLAFEPHPALLALPGGALVRPAGALLLLMAAGYAAAAALHRAPLRLGRFTIPFPPLRLVAGQFVLSILDWALATAIFYYVLPPGRIGFGELLSAFLAGQILGLLSHVPGGLGVFEGTMMLLLRPYFPAEQILSALVLYRVLYYLVPLAAALAILVADEVRQRRHHFVRLGGAFGALTRQLAPKVLAVFTFLAGALLLFSGATPAAGGRIGWLSGFVPLAVTEASHFLASVVGVGLLVASNGVARRLDVAYYFAAAGLVAGIVASLLKAADYEEALLLAGVLAALVPSRAEFDRKAAFWAARFSPGWIAAVLAVVGASIWLGFFAYKHVEYTSDLWWEFAVDRSAPRFLRASVGATMAILAFGVLRLLRPAPPEVRQPSAGELAVAERVIAAQPSTMPYLACLRDKTLLFGEAGDAFLMYAVQGKSWVALGGPVGPPERAPELIRAFIERADDFGGDPAFYQVPRDRLHLYADFGLTFAKLGEEAYVPLDSFTLDGAARKPFRLVLNRFARAGLVFRVVPPEGVPALLPELREVSDAWLRSKGAAEKGFSLGFFDPDYLARFPAAVVEDGGSVAAFATVWPGPDGTELSVDLMRYRPDAPRDVMEATLLHLMLWGKEQGYARFNLGMAPLSGLELSALAPAWNRVGHFLFHQGEGIYNFQGLRAYKEKFHPVWEPRYLAYAPGLHLPRLAADLSALVAGGYRRIFR